MLSDRDLVEKAVAGNLLGSEALFEPDTPSLPDRYELVRLIGQGGGGSVFLAQDTTLDRPVAVKILSGASPADLERFRREARFTARLNNPSIVQVYELGESGDQPYIAMQFVDGVNLADADLGTEPVVRVIREVAEAMRHAHDAGIVHRDIKPENILVDQAGRAYLTDFGIARNLKADLGETISREGQIMGTPALMPPEQARGEIEAVDARSDVYALGATLFFKLTGAYPFEGSNVIDVLHAVIHEPAPLLRSRNASLPRALETLVYTCMQKSREHRYQSMDDVVADLDRYLGGDTVASKPSAWIRRMVTQVHGKPVERADENVHDDPYWAMALELVRELAAWDANLYRVSGSLDRAFERLDTIGDRLDEVTGARPDLAWPRFYRGVVLHRRGRLREALEEMERSIDRIKGLPGAMYELGRLYLALYLREHHVAHKHVTRIGTEQDLVCCRGRLEQAVVAFEEAERAGGEIRPWLSEYSQAVARLAEADYDGCVALCDRIIEHDPDIEEVWKLRGDTQRLAGLDPFESYERAVVIRRSYFEALYARAEAHLARDELVEARIALEQACEIHGGFAEALALMAQTWLVEARRGGAADALERARALAERARDIDATSYDAAVTVAETHLDDGARRGDDETLAAASRVLDEAIHLEGCGNRVNLLIARVSLERARLAGERGGDAQTPLDRALALAREGASITENASWLDLLARAQRLESELSRS